MKNIENDGMNGDGSFRLVKDITDEACGSDPAIKLGPHAARIAHDLRSPLAVITMSRSLLKSRVIDKEVFLRHLDTAISQMEGLVNDILDLSACGDVMKSPLDLEACLLRAAAFVKPILPDAIKLKIEVAGDIWPVEADRKQIERMAGNLIRNAGDIMAAMEEGVLTVKAANRLLIPGEGFCRAGAPAGHFVEVCFNDTGPGMSRETMDRLFEPRFGGEGRRSGGFGMAIVREIVSRHQGFMLIVSKMGVGTSISCFLPALPPPQHDGTSLAE